MKYKKLSSLSIFFPCYNDEKTIYHLINEAYSTGRKVTRSLEVIVVNDGSTDNSKKQLTKAKSIHPSLKIIHHQKNKGYGGALRSGFKAASKDFVFYTDGDAQYDIKELSLLVAKMNSKVDIVNGKIDNSTTRDIFGNFYSLCTKILFNIPIARANVAFRLIRKSALDKITLELNSAAFCIELVAKLHMSGANFVEIPVSHYSRKYGRSQFFTFKRIARTVIDNFQLFIKLYLS